ncbi:hypothetical protein E2986_12855 [Frieseomelitta varia]|uniref:Uncharacterized protein n=1 Tax=Frieseomelitta varia TaxID=561572 RepID=A0A833W6D5_9HYME|nr:hypothetical protein E2986_12855 [Frieseomelitta varia]
MQTYYYKQSRSTTIFLISLRHFSTSSIYGITLQEFVQQLKKIIKDVHFDSQRIHRAIESVEDRPKQNWYDTPCGWNTYDSVIRQATIFMPNMSVKITVVRSYRNTFYENCIYSIST